MILTIGEWVLREACRQLHQWHCQGFPLPRVSVNVSPLQLQRQDLLSIVTDAVTSNGLCTQALELEILESALVENSGRSVVSLKSLQEIGVKISIDDFGTGYSSLSYLRSLPIDIIKIDRSFLLNAHTSKEDELILASIITMSHRLGLEVVTEGVEYREHADVLKKHHCQEAQGYYYARPMPADVLFQRYIASQRHTEDARPQSPDSYEIPCCISAEQIAISCGQEPDRFCLRQPWRPLACNGGCFRQAQEGAQLDGLQPKPLFP